MKSRMLIEYPRERYVTGAELGELNAGVELTGYTTPTKRARDPGEWYEEKIDPGVWEDANGYFSYENKREHRAKGSYSPKQKRTPDETASVYEYSSRKVYSDAKGKRSGRAKQNYEGREKPYSSKRAD